MFVSSFSSVRVLIDPTKALGIVANFPIDGGMGGHRIMESNPKITFQHERARDVQFRHCSTTD
jgi:hypothetical protein